ncbi:MAG: ribosome biogenesis GTPase Der, partial [Sulfurimicrobium sp.]|nr:ribosome biogenesis GTPase Der [Sulfurimicrobium sp.]
YKRYLESTFRKAFELEGTPLRVQFKQGQNPFAGRTPGPKTEDEEKAAHRKRRRSRKTYGKKY